MGAVRNGLVKMGGRYPETSAANLFFPFDLLWFTDKSFTPRRPFDPFFEGCCPKVAASPLTAFL
jgi:hypothetical protein